MVGKGVGGKGHRDTRIGESSCYGVCARVSIHRKGVEALEGRRSEEGC